MVLSLFSKHDYCFPSCSTYCPNSSSFNENPKDRGFFHDRSQISSLRHPFDVLRKFLHTYSLFNWENNVVTVTGPVPIQNGTYAVQIEKNNHNNRQPCLLKALANQFSNILIESTVNMKKQINPSKFQIRICNIQDPVECNNNLGIPVTRSNLLLIERALKSAHEHLEYTIGYCLWHQQSTENDRLYRKQFDTYSNNNNNCNNENYNNNNYNKSNYNDNYNNNSIDNNSNNNNNCNNNCNSNCKSLNGSRMSLNHFHGNNISFNNYNSSINFDNNTANHHGLNSVINNNNINNNNVCGPMGLQGNTHNNNYNNNNNNNNKYKNNVINDNNNDDNNINHDNSNKNNRNKKDKNSYNNNNSNDNDNSNNNRNISNNNDKSNSNNNNNINNDINFSKSDNNQDNVYSVINNNYNSDNKSNITSLNKHNNDNNNNSDNNSDIYDNNTNDNSNDDNESNVNNNDCNNDSNDSNDTNNDKNNDNKNDSNINDSNDTNNDKKNDIKNDNKNDSNDIKVDTIDYDMHDYESNNKHNNNNDHNNHDNSNESNIDDNNFINQSMNDDKCKSHSHSSHLLTPLDALDKKIITNNIDRNGGESLISVERKHFSSCNNLESNNPQQNLLNNNFQNNQSKIEIQNKKKKIRKRRNSDDSLNYIRQESNRADQKYVSSVMVEGSFIRAFFQNSYNIYIASNTYIRADLKGNYIQNWVPRNIGKNYHEIENINNNHNNNNTNKEKLNVDFLAGDINKMWLALTKGKYIVCSTKSMSNLKKMETGVKTEKNEKNEKTEKKDKKEKKSILSISDVPKVDISKSPIIKSRDVITALSSSLSFSSLLLPSIQSDTRIATTTTTTTANSFTVPVLTDINSIQSIQPSCQFSSSFSSSCRTDRTNSSLSIDDEKIFHSSTAVEADLPKSVDISTQTEDVNSNNYLLLDLISNIFSATFISMGLNSSVRRRKIGLKSDLNYEKYFYEHFDIVKKYVNNFFSFIREKFIQKPVFCFSSLSKYNIIAVLLLCTYLIFLPFGMSFFLSEKN